MLLEGACTVEADGERFELGPRAGVFEQLPWTLYLPRDTEYRIEGEAELAIASARCNVRREPVLQRPDEVDVEVRGAGNATRQINNMIQPGFPAERLLVVEVLTPAGSWSSYPPHKHDEDAAARGGAARGGLLLPRAGARGLRAAAALQPRVRRRRDVGRARRRPAPGAVRLPPLHGRARLRLLLPERARGRPAHDGRRPTTRRSRGCAATWADMPKDPRVPLVTA